ncbi:type II toxin-antitoxin system HicB family antitoxin [Methylocucumis oryzae]|uniref:Transcriptional regulator n=1 Tax=Methylocucumis oryzae TaxID=1632867 RepID=A0A0F3IK93_9GAMM|nr:type II toxin-antitoxin system HicB family antitoxin [Methylocucumis oryzae]KJV07116.1 transcriptional regulator [Methylocucumis oryzae]
MFDYPVVLTPDNGRVLVVFPDIPEAITFGIDEGDALKQAVDALETALSFYIDDRKPLPIASVQPGLPTVCPSALESLKLAIYSEMLRQGIRKAELARRLGWKAPQVDRLFDLNHASKLEQLELAAKALGRHIQVTLTP